MKDRVVYTAIIGNIDSLVQPRETDPRYDFLCYVRSGTRRRETEGAWQIRELPEMALDDRMLARYVKTHPEDLLQGYSWCVWVDGNIAVKSPSFYSLVESKIAGGVQVAICAHPYRDCAYDEALAVLSAGKARLAEMSRAVDFLAAEGFPRHAGLFETNVVLRAIGPQSVRRMDKLWWKCISEVSRRDQLSLVRCARKADVTIDTLFPAGTNVRDCEWVSYEYHDRTPARSFLGKKWNGLRQFVSKILLRLKIAAKSRNLRGSR